MTAFPQISLAARALLVGVAVAGSVAAPMSLRAQGMITVPKAAAQRAVAATNAHTNAMQSPTAQAPAGATAPTTHTPTSAAPAPLAKAPVPVAPQPTKTVIHTGTVTPAPVPTKTTVVAGKPAATPAAPLKPVAVAPRGKLVGKAGTAAAPASDSAARSISVTERGVKGEVSLSREVYSYDPGGRRDPFASLLRTGDLRPMLSDLRLVVVLYDPTGRNSIAIMRDVSTKDQYRVKVGQTVGRMRVAQIQPKEIVFTIEEVGFSRQEPLALGDSSTARTQ
jgi:hypothetical protein